MLDTNIVSDLVRNPDGKAAARLRAVRDHGLAVSIITAAELRFGAAKSGSPRLLSRVEAIFDRLAVLRLMFRPMPNTQTFALNWRPPESRSGRMTF
jgi:tRNA(fMet)-specific endonuclease VapC